MTRVDTEIPDNTLCRPTLCISQCNACEPQPVHNTQPNVHTPTSASTVNQELLGPTQHVPRVKMYKTVLGSGPRFKTEILPTNSWLSLCT